MSKANNGYLMIELMIAVSIAVIGILSILGFLSRSLGINRIVSDQFTANYLAMEGIEVVKNIIDANVIACLDGMASWNDGFTTNDSFEISYNSDALQLDQNRRILFDSSTGRYNYTSGNPTSFIRTININPISSEEIQVNSIVSWTTRGSGSLSVNLEDHFFNWLCTN
ncbi:MAG: hypothetical protein V3T98_01750 [Candidatus Paceibacterota bacterium]